MNKESLRSIGLLILRLGMGLGIASHGYQKLFGGIMPQLIDGVRGMGFPLPVAFAWIAALSEFVGGLLIALGLKTRIASLFVLCTMIVAAFVALKGQPFQAKELALAYLVMAGALFLTGPGHYSLDRS